MSKKITLEGLQRYHDDMAMQCAMSFGDFIKHGLEVAVERNESGTDINSAASAWVTKGYLTQADAAEIAALVTARDNPPEEPEEPEAAGSEEQGGGE